MDPNTNLTGSSESPFEEMKTWLEDPLRCTAIAQDDTLLGSLVLVLTEADDNTVTTVLQILHRLAEFPSHRSRMKNFIGMMVSLEELIDSAADAIQSKAQEVHDLILEESSCYEVTHPPPPSLSSALHDSSNQEHTESRTATKKSRVTRRNSVLMRPGAIKGKTVTLQIRGLHDREDMEVCRNMLLQVKGVISITFNFNQKRSILRTRMDVKPELLAQSISRTQTMVAEQVVKDDQGKEVLVSFGQKLEEVNKENEKMPDYPEDESPVRGFANMAPLGATPKAERGWGFVRAVGDFITTSFYW